MMRYGETPMETPAHWRNAIIHAHLAVGDALLMGADTPPDRNQTPSGFSVALDVTQPAEAERIFSALAEEGMVQMPMAETFWAVRFGMVTDRFGTPWMISCEQAA